MAAMLGGRMTPMLLRISILWAALLALLAVGPSAVCAQPAGSDRAALATDLGDPAKVRDLRSRLSGSWRILGMDAASLFVQGNLVGKALAAAGRNCGTSVVWDANTPPSKMVWPVVLTKVSTKEIEHYLAQPWLAAHQSPPGYLQGAAQELSRRVGQTGLGLLGLSIQNSPLSQELNFVFADGHRVTSANDLAVFDYSVISTMAGFRLPEGSPVGEDYSFLAAFQQQLEMLVGTNDTRMERICRALGVITLTCSGDLQGASSAGVEQALSQIDARCIANGDGVRALQKIEQDITSAVQK